MEHRDDYQSEAAALTAVAAKLGCSPDSLRTWNRQVQRDGGERPGPTSEAKARIKALARENRGKPAVKAVLSGFPSMGYRVTITAAPAAAKVSAIARPMPAPAPVTTATSPVS